MKILALQVPICSHKAAGLAECRADKVLPPPRKHLIVNQLHLFLTNFLVAGTWLSAIVFYPLFLVGSFSLFRSDKILLQKNNQKK